MSNIKFRNALSKVPQACPPIWFMRQAGRYHAHYQALRSKNSFMQLCQTPELAAEVALGPIDDFDFDVAILFSDILFPLDAIGMGLDFSPGPKLNFRLTPETFSKLDSSNSCYEKVLFQQEALKLTRKQLPSNKSLVGFIGGCWTLYTYAKEGQHSGNLIDSKIDLELYSRFSELMLPFLEFNIQIQLDGGAEVVYIFDTSAGALSAQLFNTLIVPQIKVLAQKFPGKLFYYTKTSTPDFYTDEIFHSGMLAGLGFDHHWNISSALSMYNHQSVQGNFDQTLLFCPQEAFEKHLIHFLQDLPDNKADRAGWICGLGHGVLPKTPVENVRNFVKTVREFFA